MTVKYKKSVGVIFIVLGLLFACLYFVIALEGGQTSTPLTVCDAFVWGTDAYENIF